MGDLRKRRGPGNLAGITTALLPPLLTALFHTTQLPPIPLARNLIAPTISTHTTLLLFSRTDLELLCLTLKAEKDSSCQPDKGTSS